MTKLTPIAAALLLFSGAAGATTFGPLTATPNPATLSGGSAKVTFSTSLSHADNVSGSCGLRLDYGDGSQVADLLIHAADNSVASLHVYVKVGAFTAKLTPVSVVNPAGATRPACSGAPQSATVTVNAPSGPGNITALRVVPNGPTGDKYIEDKPLSVEVSGDSSGPCGYRITGENLVNHNTVKSKLFTTFGTHEAITFKGHTRYRVSVEGEKSGSIPACKGQQSQDIAVMNNRIWIYNVRMLAHRDYSKNPPNTLAYLIYSRSEGDPCDFEVTWKARGTQGSYSKTVKSNFGKGLNETPQSLPWIVDSGGLAGPTTSADSVTVTVKGVGPNACNGDPITKTLSKIPEPNLVGPEVVAQ